MVLFLEMEVAKCQGMCGWNRNKRGHQWRTKLCHCQGAGLLPFYVVLYRLLVNSHKKLMSRCKAYGILAGYPSYLLESSLIYFHYQHCSMNLLWKYLITVTTPGIDLQEWEQMVIWNLRSNCLLHGPCNGLQMDLLQIEWSLSRVNTIWLYLPLGS